MERNDAHDDGDDDNDGFLAALEAEGDTEPEFDQDDGGSSLFPYGL